MVLYFRIMLEGRNFKILTDSEVVTENLQLQIQSDILKRLVVDLRDFSYDFDHIKVNINPADYISMNINNITFDTNLQNILFQVNHALLNANIKKTSIFR